MAKAIRFHQPGSADVLQLENIKIGDPGPGQVRLEHRAIGLNFADIYFRSGLYPVPLPSGIGSQAAGVVKAIGPGVSGIKEGDRVTYTGAHQLLGAYSTERLIDAAALIPLPDSIPFDIAAAVTMRGLTAAYLLRRIYPFAGGEKVLVHAAAGGLGSILSQWGKLLGLNVIGTTSSSEKFDLARSLGCDQVFDSRAPDLGARIKEYTGGGVDVVFDGVGRDTFAASLDALRRRGLMVCVGTASGTIPPFDPQLLAIKGSLYLTRPGLADYIADPAERADLAGELFGHIASGNIRIDIQRQYRLEDAAEAHRDLEAKRITGAAILIPQGSFNAD